MSTKEYAKAYYHRVAKHKRWKLANHLKKYDLTLDEYDAMLRKNAGECAICNAQCHALQIDHNHGTGQVRGLLCRKCNVSLAAIEDTAWKARAERYIHA